MSSPSRALPVNEARSSDNRASTATCSRSSRISSAKGGTRHRASLPKRRVAPTGGGAFGSRRARDVPRSVIAAAVSTLTAPAVHVGQAFDASMRGRAIGVVHFAIRVRVALDAGRRRRVADAAPLLRSAVRVCLTFDAEASRYVTVGSGRAACAARGAPRHARVRVQVAPERGSTAIGVRYARDAPPARRVAVRRVASTLRIGHAFDALVRGHIARVAVPEVRTVRVPHALDADACARITVRSRGRTTSRRCTGRRRPAPAPGSERIPIDRGRSLVASTRSAQKDDARKRRKSPDYSN